MIFNNVFYDITQFDISSDRGGIRNKTHLRNVRHRSHNSSLRKRGSNERSLNLSLERSQVSSKEQQSGISLLKKSGVKPPLPHDSQPRF